jgi:cobalamin biosynthesis protein CobT
MSGRKLELAGEAAIVLGDVLNTLRVPFAVYGYSTENPLPNQTPRDKGPYARWSRLWIRYYRDFGESWDKGAVRLAGAGHNVQNNTLDAESVKHGIRRLLQRKEKRKILFVLNDGMPYPGYGHLGRCQDHLHDVVASASAAGVEVVAFGIQDDDVKQYYPSHVVIKKLEDLAKEPLQVLDGMLRKGVRVK